MQTSRNKLLITLALLCAMALGAAAVCSAGVRLGRAPLDGRSYTTAQPGITPNSGEPDVTNGQGPLPSRYSLGKDRGDGGPAPVVSAGRYVAVMSRWARVFWMARYLGLTP